MWAEHQPWAWGAVSFSATLIIASSIKLQIWVAWYKRENGKIVCQNGVKSPTGPQQAWENSLHPTKRKKLRRWKHVFVMKQITFWKFQGLKGFLHETFQDLSFSDPYTFEHLCILGSFSLGKWGSWKCYDTSCYKNQEASTRETWWTLLTQSISTSHDIAIPPPPNEIVFFFAADVLHTCFHKVFFSHHLVGVKNCHLLISKAGWYDSYTIIFLSLICV